MKKMFSLIIFLSLTTGKIKSQTLTFTYDTAGNQMQREYCASCTPYSKVSNKIGQENTDTLDNVSQEVKIYPNPTKDKVTMIWTGKLDDMIQSIEYVAYNFTQYRSIPFIKGENKLILDLSTQPIGLYVVLFYLKTGEKLTYKILKN
jgi:hypothetical protein